MRVATIAVAICALVGTANAQVDPRNWCPSPPTIPVAVDAGVYVMGEHRIQRTSAVATTAVAPGEQVALIETAPAPRRTLASAVPELDLQAGAELIPVWAARGRGDVLDPGEVWFCAISSSLDPRTRRRAGACLSNPSADGVSNRAQSAFFSANEITSDSFDGWVGNDRERSRYGTWTLGPETQASHEARARPLRVATVTFGGSADRAQTPYTWVNMEFVLEGLRSFTRSPRNPLRLEDGWLVVTGIAPGGAVSFQRMSDSEWRTFQAARCPSGRP